MIAGPYLPSGALYAPSGTIQLAGSGACAEVIGKEIQFAGTTNIGTSGACTPNGTMPIGGRSGLVQ
jgi:hypothetical protein